MTITANDLITTSSFNTIQATVASILASNDTGYGSNVSSTPVLKDNNIAAAQWLAVWGDLGKIYAHQNNTALTAPFGVIVASTGSVVYANFADYVRSTADTLSTNRYTVAAGQLAAVTTNMISSRTSAWGSNLVHQVTYLWNSTAEMNYFFNLGGYIDPVLSSNGGSGTAEELAWQSLVTTFNADDTNTQYKRSKFALGNPNQADTVVADDGTRSIKINYAVDKNARTIVATVTLIWGSRPGSTDIGISSTLRYWRSRNDVTPTGILSPSPQATTTVDLATGGAITPVVIPTKILAISPSSLSYTFTATTTSSFQTVTLTNNGNTALSVTNVNFQTGGSFTAVVPTPLTTPTTIAAGANATFQLAWYRATAATGYVSMIVTSDDPVNPVQTIQVNLTCTAPPFDFTLTPSSITVNKTDLSPYSQNIVITPINGSFGSYSAYLSGPVGPFGTEAFTFTNPPTGPTIGFNPVSKTNGTYTVNVTVTVNSIQKVVPVTVILSAPQSYNIGAWVGAQAYDNAVVGFSYDMIGGQKYLTIGIGVGSDGSPTLNNGGTSFSLGSNLNYLTDSGYTTGVAMYAPARTDGWNTFNATYATWVRPNDVNPVGTFITRSWTFTTMFTGNHTINTGVDNAGSLYIDGSYIGELGTFNSTNTYTVNLSAGAHSIRVENVINYQYGAGIAVQILFNSTEIWSTLLPKRSIPPYLYWAEASRIPLTGSAQTYYSGDHLIKDTVAAIDSRYNDYFGSGSAAGSLFTVVDDGFGNLTVTVNNRNTNTSGYPTVETTLNGLVYCLKYYEEAVTRFSNLSTPLPNNQTLIFNGFLTNGTVRTYTGNYTPASSGGSGGGGGGCPAPEMEILMHDGTTVPAGDIKPGMMVLTRHETTDELGQWPVTAVSMMEDERWIVKFEDGREFIGTFNHRMLTTDGWLEINKMTVGQTVIGQPNGIVASAELYDQGPVVKITVDQAHTYISQGLLSHNIKLIDNNFLQVQEN